MLLCHVRIVSWRTVPSSCKQIIQLPSGLTRSFSAVIVFVSSSHSDLEMNVKWCLVAETKLQVSAFPVSAFVFRTDSWYHFRAWNKRPYLIFFLFFFFLLPSCSRWVITRLCQHVTLIQRTSPFGKVSKNIPGKSFFPGHTCLLLAVIFKLLTSSSVRSDTWKRGDVV